MPAADYTDANLPGTTVDKLNVLGSGLALAITLALLNSVCAILVNLWPQQAIAFANTWAHGLDLKPLMADSSLTVARFTYGLIGLAGIGFLIGAVYAWLYNRLRTVGRPGG